MTKYLFPRLRDIIFSCLLITILLFGPRTFSLDGDLGRHLTIGNYILDTHIIPHSDLFSHTMISHPLTPHEWLAQVIFALVHRGLSLAGVVFVTAVIVAGTFTLTFQESVRRSSTVLIALGISILAAAASSLHWLARPHMFTLLFLAIWTSMLERLRTDKKMPIWLFGLVMLLWANTHGAFIAGFVIWAAYLGGELLESWVRKDKSEARLKSLGLIGVLSFCVTLVNPVGIHLWETSLGFVSNSYLVSHTQEYMPPDFHNPSYWPFLLLLAILLLTVTLGSRNQGLPFTHILLLTGWAAMGLYSARNIPLFAIVAAPILSTIMARLLSRYHGWTKIENNILQIEQSLRGELWIGISFVLAVTTTATPAMRVYNSFDSIIFPVDAVNWLDEHPQEGNIFNYFPWGGYLLFRVWPETLVFIDGQTDFYGEALTREYEQVITLAPGWQEILDKYQVDWALIPHGWPLPQSLAEEGWQEVYSDPTAIILRRGK